MMTTLSKLAKPAKALSSVRYLAFVLVALSLTIVFAGKANSTTSDNTSGSDNAKKYLFLNAEQLKPLGVELSKEGLFYMNINPERECRYCYKLMAFHYGRELVHAKYPTPEKIKTEPTFKGKEFTNFDFFPVFIGYKGEYSFMMDSIDNMALLPVAICMSETKIKDRTDTIVLWFCPTEALQQALPKGIVMEDYLRVPEPYKNKGALEEFYKSLSGEAETWKMLVTDIGDGTHGERDFDLPKYPKGGKAFYKYLTENIKYPQAFDPKNFKGAIATVLVEFHVGEDGSISRIEPICYINADNKTIDLDKDGELIASSCNKEAVRVVENMPKWIPSQEYEYMSEFRVTLPIIFATAEQAE